MRSRARVALVLAVAAIVLPVVAGAATQNVLGKLFLVRDPRPGVDATKRRAVVTARETHSAATIVGDPTATGAKLTILANGGTSTMETLLLPLDAWQRDSSTSYTYDDAAALHGPVERVTIRRTGRGTFSIKVRIGGAQGAFSVVPPDPGTDGGISLEISAGDTYCVAFGGTAGGVVTNHDATLFKVRRPTAKPGCPTQATTTSTSVSTTTSSTIPIPACGSFAGPPLCWGECPPDTPICADVGGTCQCVAGTTPCQGSPGGTACDGACPAGQACISGGFDCACMPTDMTPCFGGAGPTCGGFCPTDETCVFFTSPDFSLCVCAPPTCFSVSSCGGPCPSGRSCQAVPIPGSGISCLCIVP